jgi:ADP-ribosylglycohydrolase/fructose-1,6-bisphosphatase/inositol monophosphatase family enzyme
MDLKHALELARAAARDAAARLRADFHRPGGPRGEGHHAEVDEEAERAIRARLLPAFPEAGYLGEETGAAGPEHASYRWLVDPNDGTAAYLQGFRGSAVSIALVRDGVPVLGVVHAPLAPDDNGDELAWAEGGPLFRNGKPVARAPLPATLAAGQVVLVSRHADKSPEENATCCAPATFRALPSIAYRLALVAAGEAEAAVSLDSPTDWDYAAGHALLRAVGGALLGRDGKPIRYDGSSRSMYVFGGAPEIAATLAERPWANVLFGGGKCLVALPERGRAVADAGLLARAQGALLGQLAGDALGSMVEFARADELVRRYPQGLRELAGSAVWHTIAGQPTDDSELALALARTLDRRGFDPAAILAAYREWLASGPFDCGTTTRAGLQGHPVRDSQANGGLMRVSPLGVFAHAVPPERLAGWARTECAITHVHPVCRDASAAYALAIAHAVRTGDGPRLVWTAAIRHARAFELAAPVLRALEAAEVEPPVDFSTNAGWAILALQNAFYRLLHAPSLEEGLVDTVRAGGDTDTNAAIAGALLGAVHGRDAVPERWRRVLLGCRPLPGTPQPRPPAYWPVDAWVLAERLLVAGREVHRA